MQQTPTYPEDKPLPPRPAYTPFPNTPTPTQDKKAPSPALPPRRQTVLQPADAPPQTLPSLTQRKVVGVLVTYSWKADGEIYPIREGRNLIGRDADCDICIAMDQTLSGRNSHITYRTAFVVGDLVSMKGTDLNGEPIEEQFRGLPNYSTIRAGSTHFTFIAINPPEPREGD
jgi:hypothetical protein